MGSSHSSQSLGSPAKCKTNGKIMTAEMEWTIKNFGFKSKTSPVGSMLKSAPFSAVENKTVHWELRVYPNGAKGGKGNVSLYVAVSSNNATSPALILANVSLRLFDNSNSVIKKLLVVKNWNHEFKPKVSTTNGYKSVIDQSKVSEIESLIISCKVKYEINGEYPTPAIIVVPSVPAGSSLSEHNAKLFKTMHNSDVCFRVDDQEIRAHKSILISRSPVFTAMFDHQMKENQTRVVEIVDINPDTFRSVLYFMYTDKVQLKTEEETKKMLIAADKYMLHLLKHKCEEFLISRVCSSNFMELLALAHVHSALDLKKAALEFIPQEIARDEEKTMTAITKSMSTLD